VLNVAWIGYGSRCRCRFLHCTGISVINCLTAANLGEISPNFLVCAKPTITNGSMLFQTYTVLIRTGGVYSISLRAA
jgi:hypothetical protein